MGKGYGFYRINHDSPLPVPDHLPAIVSGNDPMIIGIPIARFYGEEHVPPSELEGVFMDPEHRQMMAPGN
jgi:hypothetical protein